jgi:phage FluMu protein Com
MRFSCEHCGRLLTVADKQAGRKGRCPECQKTITIPVVTPEEADEHAAPGTGETPGVEKPSPRDFLLLDIPPAGVASGPQNTEETDENQQAAQADYVLKSREEPPKRALPWIIDIFLYPLNASGMMILSLCAGIPFVLRVLLKLSYALFLVFPPAVILWLVLWMIHWAAMVVFLLYINWYVVECIRDSAAGGIRAMNTSGLTPGFAELFQQALTSLACGFACMIPAILYRVYGGSGDPVFWFLYGLGGFLFPMAMLAVTLFESLRALNPVLLLGSIFSTFAPYCLLAGFCWALCVLTPIALRRLIGEQWYLGYCLLFASFYLLLVLAHLIGRFCWKYEEKLNWEA